MQSSDFPYAPIAPLYLLGLGLLLLLLIAGLIYFNVLGYAYEKIGLRRKYVFSLLLLSLIGSSINIPIARLQPEPIQREIETSFLGIHYVIPVLDDWQRTILAVNVGGAIIPTGLAFYLLVRNRLYWQSLLGVPLVSLMVNVMAQPVKGVGIAVPLSVPPIAAAGVALILSHRRAAPLAFIVGTLGTLIGADLMNLGHIAGLGAPVASIGGAGTFDGIFLVGILAVLLA